MKRCDAIALRSESFIRRLFLLVAILLGVMRGGVVDAVEQGTTPASAIELSTPEVQGTVRSSTYYMISAAFDGMLDISLIPVGGEIDLAVIHVSGSPAIESRKEGEAREEISLRVVKGDRFLIRVISPFGRSVSFKLSAVISQASSSASVSRTFLPRMEGDGRSESSAIVIPLGRVIPVQAGGQRFFRVKIPKGAVLSVSLYPVLGDADLMVKLGDILKTSGSSHRAGLFSEHVFLPTSEAGEAWITVAPTTGNNIVSNDINYGIVARLRHFGVTSVQGQPDPSDREAAVNAFADASVGTGIPWQPTSTGWEFDNSNRTGVLRLP